MMSGMSSKFMKLCLKLHSGSYQGCKKLKQNNNLCKISKKSEG